MGNELFGIDISGLVAEHIGPGLLPGKLTRTPRGERNPQKLAGGRTEGTPEVFDFQGIWEDFDPSDVDGVNILTGDRKALIIGDTLKPYTDPRKDDAVQIEGLTQVCVRILSRDPAKAAWVLLCRDRAGVNGA